MTFYKISGYILVVFIAFLLKHYRDPSHNYIISVGYMSGRVSVGRVYVWSGKCPSGICLVG